MRRNYERRIQSIADSLESKPGIYGLQELYLSQVLEAVEALEHEGLTLDRIFECEELVAERIRTATAARPY